MNKTFYKLDINENNILLGNDGTYHYLYKITNIINDHFYYGVHTTNNIYDNYIGSGTRLHKAYKKYGINNFKKEILQYFETEEEMFQKEFEIVNNDLIKNDNCYNIVIGGGKSLFKQTVVKDVNGKISIISLDDPRYLSGELVGVAKDTVTVKNMQGEYLRIHKDIFKESNEFVGITTGKVIVHDKLMNTFMVDTDDPRYLSGELTFLLKTLNKDMTTVKDLNNKYLRVNKNDPRYLSGELVGVTKNKIVVYNNNHQKFIDPSELEKYEADGWKRECLNKGKCKVLKNGTLKTISAAELEKYEADGWIRTNKTKGLINIYKDNKYKKIDPSELEKYEADGWRKGCANKSCLGKIAVNKNGIKKFIDPSELEKYEADGWRKGFKPKN